MLKYNHENLNYPLNDDVLEVEEAYKKYHDDPNGKLNYFKLEYAVYNMSLAIKQEKVLGTITSVLANDLNDYFWSLIC